MKIDPKAEKKRIVDFLKSTFSEQKVNKAVIGISGGIDSITSLFLMKEALSEENIMAVHLPYFKEDEDLKQINDVPIEIISIKSIVDEIIKTREIAADEIRRGNIMARVRMIILFDLAKKHNALVCGTENKTEHYLAYFTRFGDEASDIEPIKYLYKTQVYQLAKYMNVPSEFLKKAPSAGLWTGQTDENQFGFSYKEADQVLYLHFEENLSLEEIKTKGFQNAEKILAWVRKNEFKHKVPYSLLH